ncbi:MAG: hypothetical protein IT361_04485 [Gemmatimonadaceae bacterium]|nr:hypothetical protein [Gemmatimonadaceae bacterium]
MPDLTRLLFGETQARLLALLRRGPRSIMSLAQALGITDNAVRLHVTELRRDALVDDVGVDRDTGGKPARLYGLTGKGEELYPKAYALVLNELVAELVRTQGHEGAIDLLRGVGTRLAPARGGSSSETSDLESRVSAAAAALRDLGADIDTVPLNGGGWRLQGYACPLTAVTGAHREVCEVVRTIVAAIAGQPVEECCDRTGERSRCAFEIVPTNDNGRGEDPPRPLS